MAGNSGRLEAEEYTQVFCVKGSFPGLLHKLCISLCGDNEDKLFSQNLIAGFRKCGIIPLNRKEVLSRLPANESSSIAVQQADDVNSSTAAAVSSAVLDHLS